MQMLAKIAGLIGIVLVMATAGCIGGVAAGGNANTGVKTVRFVPNAGTVKGTGYEKVEMLLELQNVGDALATDVDATVFNYGTSMSLAPGAEETFVFGNLEPRFGNAPGEQESYSYVFNIKSNELGMDDTVDVGARITYGYDSRGRVESTIVPKADYKAGVGGRVSHEGYSSNGPVQVKVRVEQPVIVSDVVDTFSVYVDLVNIGVGRVRSERGYDYIDYVDFQVPAGIDVGGYCDFSGDIGDEGGVLTIKHSGSSTNERLKLTDGTRTLFCRLKVNETSVQRSVEFGALAGYTYQQDSYARLRVKGVSE